VSLIHIKELEEPEHQALILEHLWTKVTLNVLLRIPVLEQILLVTVEPNSIYTVQLLLFGMELYLF
jgi:hypothetical protein